MVPVDDATALAAALGAVLDDAALADRLRAAGTRSAPASPGSGARPSTSGSTLT